MTASSPQSRPCLSQAARGTEASSRWNRPGFGSAGVTGENSPHYTNQPEKKKNLRVPVKYFFSSTPLADHRRKQWTAKELRSGPEQVQLLRCAAARFSGDAAQFFEQPVDALLNGSNRLTAQAGEFRARDTFDFELGEKLPFLLR